MRTRAPKRIRVRKGGPKRPAPNRPTWVYDEFRQIGVDFDDPRVVAGYEARQQTSVEAERALVQRLGIGRRSSVLEFGCGTGAFALAAAETGADVVAIDISPAMLRFARRQAERRNLGGIEFLAAGFLRHDQPDGSADFVVSKFTLHHLPDFWKVIALRRIARLLRPEGRLYLQDVVFSFEVDQHAREIEGWIESASASGSFNRSEFEAHVRDEFSTFGWLMEEMMIRAGLRILSKHYYSKVQAEYVCGRNLGRTTEPSDR